MIRGVLSVGKGNQYACQNTRTPGEPTSLLFAQNTILHFWKSKLRTILIETWEALPERFPGVSLDEFVIMPDHIHFILWLDDNVEHPPTLNRVLQVYKSITTVAWLKHIKLASLERPGKFWQRRSFERVIRDSRELEQTRQYIQDNPRKLCTPECSCEEDEDQSND